MSNGPWTDKENDLIVADYFAMLADDISALRYSKAEHRRAPLPLVHYEFVVLHIVPDWDIAADWKPQPTAE